MGIFTQAQNIYGKTAPKQKTPENMAEMGRGGVPRILLANAPAQNYRGGIPSSGQALNTTKELVEATKRYKNTGGTLKGKRKTWIGKLFGA